MAKYYLEDIPPVYNINEVQPKEKDIRQAQRLANTDFGQVYRRIAAGSSVIGGGISLIPHPVAKGVGIALQVPDIAFDVYDLIKQPSIKNGIHAGLDFGSQLRHVIPGNIDDVFLQIPGAIDDGYNAITGRDILEDSYNFVNRKSTPKLTYNIKNGNTIKDKTKYRKWLSEVAGIKGWNVKDMDKDETYDYQLFYNMQPKEAQAILNKSKDAHFTDIGKTAYHPTFSDESYYSGRFNIFRNPRGIKGGRWSSDGKKYTLSKSQIDNNWNIRNTIDYLSINEPNGVALRMPNGTMPYIDGAYFDRVLPQIVITPKRNKSK